MGRVELMDGEMKGKCVAIEKVGVADIEGKT
jgi:hypothetical protein